MYKLLITLTLLLSCIGARAQSTTDSTRREINYSAGVEPFYGFINCAKFFLEVKPDKSAFGFEITPEFYSGNKVSEPNDRISGFGIGFYTQKYLPGSKRHPAILNFGATYRAVNINYSDKGFVSFRENGLDYYRYQQFDDVLKARNLLVNATLSYKALNRAVLLEPYMGAGYKFGSTSATYPGYRNEAKDMLDYGFRGLTWLVGVKFGFNVKR